MPLAPLKIVALGNCEEIGKKIDSIIVQRRKEAYGKADKPSFMLTDYDRDTYLVDYSCPRFGTGEGKAVINESIRGSDLFIIADTVNYIEMYSMHGDHTNMSPDDHFGLQRTAKENYRDHALFVRRPPASAPNQ